MKVNGSQILLLTDMVDSNSHQILEEETMVMELDSRLGNFDFFHDFDEDSSVDQTSFYFLCAFWFDYAFKFSFTKFQFVIFTDVCCSMYISLHIFLEFIYCCEKFNEIMLWKQIVTKTQYFTQLIQFDFDNFFFHNFNHFVVFSSHTHACPKDSIDLMFISVLKSKKKNNGKMFFAKNTQFHLLLL